MKKEYLPWICLYLGLAGLFMAWHKLHGQDAEYMETGIILFTWARIITFAYTGIALDMNWYTPATPIFNRTRALAELALLVALWQFGRHIEVVATLLAVAAYEMSRRATRYS